MADKPFFVSIVSLARRTPEQTMLEMEEQYRKCGLEYFAVSMPIQPQGKDPMEKVRNYAQQFRALLACRKNPALKTGILLQQTIGHGATWNPAFDRELDWQRMVRSNGETTIRFCPQGKEFRSYIREAVGLLTQEKPDFLIVDDDARFSTKLDEGLCECFCQEHTALFNRKYGTNYTQEELCKAVSAAPDYDPLLWKITEFEAGTLSSYMQLLRESADRFSPGIPMILCGCQVDAGKSGIWARTLAGGHHTPMLRIGNGNYLENAPRGLASRMTDTAAQKILSPPETLLLDEADTCPHNCYSKSARTMHLHITAGLLNGLDGAKLWITDTTHPAPEITAPYAEILGKYRKFYQTLYQSLRGIVWQGPLVNIPRLEALPRPNLSWIQNGLLATGNMAFYGLPFRFGDSTASGLHLLSGNDPDGFSDAELEKMLSESALIDSAAAKKLLKRGFAALIGLQDLQELTQVITGEEIVRNRRFLRRARKSDTLLIPLPEAEVLTHLLSRSAESPAVPGAIRYRNIIVTAWYATPGASWGERMEIDPDRKELLTFLLKELNGVPARFLSAGDAACRYGTGKDYNLLAAVNFGFDPLPELFFELEKKPGKIQQLLPEGCWEELPFSEQNGIFRLPVRLECAENAVFKLLY